MLPIAVEIAPLDARRDEVQVLLDACTRAAAAGECVLASDAPPGGAGAVAIVTWQTENQAFVEVGMRRDGRPEWRSRNVAFSANDELLERWRTLGFIVGTLARNEIARAPEAEPAVPSQGEPVPSPPPAPQPAKTAPSEPAPSSDNSSSSSGAALAAIDVGGELGPGFGSGLRAGGLLRAHLPLQAPLRVVTSLKYMEQNDRVPDGRWFTLGAGLAWVYGSPYAEVSAALEARLERFEAKYERVDVSAPVTPQGSTSVWLGGLGTHLSAVWMAMPALGLYASGDAEWVLGQTRIRITSASGNEQVIMDRALRVGGGAGIRLRLW